VYGPFGGFGINDLEVQRDRALEFGMIEDHRSILELN
jgi:hypothetical protein